MKNYFLLVWNYLQKQFCMSLEAYSKVWDRNKTEGLVGWFSIVFTVWYIFFVVFLWREPILFPWLLAPISIFFIFVSLGKFYKWCENINFKEDTDRESHASIWKITLCLFCAYFAYIVNQGTWEISDTLWQWRQVLEESFDDWHPVMHTFSIYLAYRFLHSHLLVVMAFVAFFCHACGWLYVSLRRFGYKNSICIGILLYICLSPVTLKMLRILFKDTAFAIAVLYLSVFLVHLWENRGKDLHRWQWYAFALLLIYASFVRHNGIFFTVPVLFFLPIARSEKKQKLILFSVMVCLCLLGYIGLRGFLTAHECLIHKVRTEQCFRESVGLPMCMMSKVMVFSPKKMPKDAHDFMLKICSQEEWRKKYHGDFNNVKFNYYDNTVKAFHETTPKEFFSYFKRTAKASPGLSCMALIQITSLGLDPFWYNNISHYLAYINDNGFLIRTLLLSPWGWIFLAPGGIVLCMIVLGTYAFLKQGYRVLLIVTPFVSYTWGTTLLLTGWDHRFFYAILIGGFPILFILANSHHSTWGKRNNSN